jgi:hypothetical protein
MSNVIRFKPANSPRRTASGDRGAQILFFTGVRYQRWNDDPRAPAEPPQRARQKREGAEIAGARQGRKSRR